jgi:hypothetical protein
MTWWPSRSVNNFPARIIRVKRSRYLYYEDIFSALGGADIRYLVIGGVALNLHGIPRMTTDLDLMVDFAETNLRRLVKVLEELSYSPKPPLALKDLLAEENRKRWLEEKNIRVFSLSHPHRPYQIIDILVENRLDFEWLYTLRKIVFLGEFQIPLVSIEHLTRIIRELYTRSRWSLGIREF